MFNQINEMNGTMPPVSGTYSPQYPEFALYDVFSVRMAALLGGPLAGTSVMAINYSRLGHKDKAYAAIGCGVAATAAAAAIGYLLPSAAQIPAAVVIAFTIGSVAQSEQGPEIDHHVNKGGPLASRFGAFGIAMAFLVFWCAIILGGIWIGNHDFDRRTKVMIGSNHTVFYSGSASQGDAQSLGDALKRTGYFGDKAATVYLAKSGGATTLSMVTADGAWNQPTYVMAFEETALDVADSIGGAPLKLQLMDSERNVKRDETVGRVVFNTKDNVDYSGGIGESEAKALGDALIREEYFTGRPVSVLLSKENGRTVISYLVADKAWEEASNVKAYVALTRKIAPSVGGAPVTVRLVNGALDVGKEVEVN